MNARRTATAVLIVALGALAFTVWGCSKKAGGTLLPNQPPTVRLTNAPYSETTRYYYSITLNWIGFDPDGRIDHFMFVIDPPREAGADTVWESTALSQITRSFSASLPDSLSPPLERRGQDFHVFVLKAVDNRGAVSAPVTRAFFSYTVAPTVGIDDPRPSDQSRAYVTPAVHIRWHGEDSDGVFTKRPVKYKFKLLTSQTEVTTTTAIQFTASKDTVRRYYAPRNWVGWDSTSSDTTEKQFISLIPDQEYVFCVIAFDEAGAYSPIFSLNTNMLWFRVTFAGANNPAIGFFNEFFFYEYPTGSWQPNNPLIEIPIEVPAGIPLVFNWYAIPKPGSAIRFYRWAVDILDLEDETARNDDDDLAHWSPQSVLITSCRLNAYVGTQTHRFYLEARDINNLKSLGIVRYTVIQSSLERNLGIVDDTRLLTDERSVGAPLCINQPIGRWPNAAELDTFLYAKGGVPWRCYPTGTVSTAGLFNGYTFDTLNTRLGLEDMTTRLSALGHFAKIIWIVDGKASSKSKPGTDRSDPTTSLRYMCDRQRANTLAAYIRQGGLVWLVGGGAATAAMDPWDNGNNNAQQPTPTKTFSNPNGELVPGRFVYDQFHWRSEFKQYTGTIQFQRELGRFNSSPGTYATLPTTLQAKSAATDPFPPNSNLRSNSDFYYNQFTAEFLSISNVISEDYNPGPGEDFRPTLDTLYKAVGVALPPGQVSAAMTYYHGQENVPVILQGFDIWSFRRTQCKAVVDFVMQRLWNQPAPMPASRARPVSAANVSASLVRPWSAAARDPVATGVPAVPSTGPRE